MSIAVVAAVFSWVGLVGFFIGINVTEEKKYKKGKNKIMVITK